jgi:hypothetical protein
MAEDQPAIGQQEMLCRGVLAVAGVETLFWLYTVALTAMTPKLPEGQVSGSAMVLSLASVAFVLFTLPALGFAIWGRGIVFRGYCRRHRLDPAGGDAVFADIMRPQEAKATNR